MTVETAVVSHHLRLFGVPTGAAFVLSRPGAGEVASARSALAGGQAVVACLPDAHFRAAFGVHTADDDCPAPATMRHVSDAPWSRLRTLHRYATYADSDGDVLVADDSGRAAWLARGALLVVGTDLASDLIRYRQGDPARAGSAPRAIWDIAGERPVYLFEDQLEEDRPFERYADHWAMALAETLATATGRALEPLLPGGAPGAVVVTGDDDQAYLETYARQLELLGEMPVTYFLHPLTRHDRHTVRRLARRSIELALHPDSLDAPHMYTERLREQVRWFVGLTGRRPVSVRNHGYLSAGYWDHLPAWLDQGIAISANLPGLDGRVLNGSLLPARLVRDGSLTPHWSILTAIGDGVVFVRGESGDQAAARIHAYAARVRASGIPGVIVLNLHPQNVELTEPMHRAATELVDEGFTAWTLADCLAWFQTRDDPHAGARRPRRLLALRHVLGRRLSGRASRSVRKPG